jgi:hypothetical protein
LDRACTARSWDGPPKLYGYFCVDHRPDDRFASYGDSDPGVGERPAFGKGAQHHQPRVPVEQRRSRRIGRKIEVCLVDDRHAVEQVADAPYLIDGERVARGIVRGTDEQQLAIVPLRRDGKGALAPMSRSRAG